MKSIFYYVHCVTFCSGLEGGREAGFRSEGTVRIGAGANNRINSPRGDIAVVGVRRSRGNKGEGPVLHRDKIWGVARARVRDGLFVAQMGLAVLLVSLTVFNVAARQTDHQRRYTPFPGTVGQAPSVRSMLHQSSTFPGDCRLAAPGHDARRSALCGSDPAVYAVRFNP